MSTPIEASAADFSRKFNALKSEIAKVIVGQDEIVEHLLISLFSKGHCVLVGVPGLAKTLLIRTLSDSLGLRFNRIQFTPDLMPGDITGTEVIEEDPETGRKRFTFIQGPIFANIVLADEINRTPPKTQAALLEAMQESQVTVSGTKHILEKPFFVLATQNPIEQEGTYPLPEAQLDRFMFYLQLDYPSFDEELDIIRRTTASVSATVEPVLSRQDILDMQSITREVAVPESVLHYAVKLVGSTRANDPSAHDIIRKYVSWGAGPRASQNLILGGKTRALAHGRFHVTEEDIRALAAPVLRHRIVLNYAAEADGLDAQTLIHRLLD
jgi:MoxR-like ATPase